MNSEQAMADYHRLRIERAVNAFDRRGFAAAYFESGADAVEQFFSEVTPDDVIGYGGSETVSRLGIRTRLAEGNYHFLDRSKFGHTYTEQLSIRRQTLAADVFVTSSNGVAIEGAIVNIDGDGNRVAGLSLGPERVYLFLGRNKLAETVDEALDRARNVASPALAIQLGIDTPCAKTGRCHDCASPNRICNIFSIIERCNPPGRIHLYLINEDLGL